MRRTNKKGFTIVELVIVIAVIAILAAVLIPTFSNLVSKANLSSDMQAVREMNIALANAEASGGKPDTIEAAMKVIADAGYDVDSWSPISSGYQVYWYKPDNRCILYSTTEAAVEYPEEYENKKFSDMDFVKDLYVYNQTFVNASKVDFEYKSSASSSVTVGGKNYSSAVVVKPEDAELKSSYACVVVQESSGKSTYTIAIESKDGATEAEKLEARKSAAEYAYSLFVQTDLGTVARDAVINVEPGTVLNLSGMEWGNPGKLFSGYFGSSDPEKPVIIDGLKLTDATGYMQTYSLEGPSATYYFSGFIGALCGNATIENVTFRNLTIENPANDMKLINPTANNNTTAIIGGVVATPENPTFNVTIRNVVVEDSCTIKGNSRTGGILGFVGGYTLAQEYSYNHSIYGELKSKYTPATGSTVNFEGCSFAGTVESLLDDSAYATVGSMLGIAIRNQNTKISFKDCEVTGKVIGTRVGGYVGELWSGVDVSFENCKSSATLTVKGTEKGGEATSGALIGRVFETEDQSKYTASSYVIDEKTLANSGCAESGSAIVGTISCGDGTVKNDAKTAISNWNTYKIGETDVTSGLKEAKTWKTTQAYTTGD